MENKKESTKQKILDSATHLFAMKGFTETTVREVAESVGVKESSIYNHFESKNSILENILDEYASIVTYAASERSKKLPELKENPTAEGIMACLTLVYPEGKAKYYLNRLYVILQEQHRNTLVRKFVSEQIIHNTERVFENIINKLKEFNILRQDTDPDFWVKMHSSIVYTFASRMLLGIGDNSPDYSGMGMYELLHNMFDMMLKLNGTGNDSIK